jgi:hypothetical protein
MQLMVQLQTEFADPQRLQRDFDARETGLRMLQPMLRTPAGYSHAN